MVNMLFERHEGITDRLMKGFAFFNAVFKAVQLLEPIIPVIGKTSVEG